MFEKMVTSIQTDEARHAQIGAPVLRVLCEHDRARAQHLLDKWFWRSWQFFAVVTGFAMDYLTPLPYRKASFKEFMQEWVIDQFARSLTEIGLERPWYWDEFIASIDHYHHMVYASAYSYRATVWFDLALPGPEERAWLRAKYPETWDDIDPIWTQVTQRWRTGGPDLEWYVHGTTPVGFCSLCQLVLCGGTPTENTARVVEVDGSRHIFCSAPCAWIFEQDRARYAGHRDVIQRILEGDAPANLLELLRTYFGLTSDSWGKDVARGRYAWLAAQEHR
jgi:toluene monooxygenase system protein A